MAEEGDTIEDFISHSVNALHWRLKHKLGNMKYDAGLQKVFTSEAPISIHNCSQVLHFHWLLQ